MKPTMKPTPRLATPKPDRSAADPTPTDRVASADAELMRRRCFAALAFLFNLVDPALRAANL